jgi:hypothetical protein
MRIRPLKRTLLAFAATALLATSLAAVPAPKVARSPEHDFVKEASGLLTEAKSIFVQLERDADEFHAMSRSGQLSWQTHAGKLNTIKAHVNKAGRLVRRLNDIRPVAAPWQQAAISRITPMLTQIATNTQRAIEHLNENQDRLLAPEYNEAAATIFEMSSQVSKLTSDFVEYEGTKTKLEQLQASLGVSS